MAYSRKKFSRKSSRKGTKRTYKRKSYAKKAPALRKMIRKEISRVAENKTAQFYDFSAGLRTVSSSDFSAQNIFPLGPNSAFSPIINQGTAQSDRIGNRIKTKKLVVKGTLIPMPLNNTTNTAPQPLLIKIWIMYDKTNPTAQPDPKGAFDFFQLGGSSIGFANDTRDMWAPVNEDRYRILTTRTYKLGYSQYGSVGSAGNSMYYNNNDFPFIQNFSIDCTKYYPKDVRFNDNNALPTTRGLFMLVECVAANGNLLPSDQTVVNMQYLQTYDFEDV